MGTVAKLIAQDEFSRISKIAQHCICQLRVTAQRPDLMMRFYRSGGFQAATVAEQAPPLQRLTRQYGGTLSSNFCGYSSLSSDRVGFAGLTLRKLERLCHVFCSKGFIRTGGSDYSCSLYPVPFSLLPVPSPCTR